MKKMRNVCMTVCLLTALGFSACTEKKSDDSSTVALLALAAASSSQSGSGFPQPALNTAVMDLNGTRFTLTVVDSCTNGGAGITIKHTSNLPELNLHQLNFNLNSGVFMGTGGIGLDLGVQGGRYMVPNGQTCAVTVKENTTTVYDVEVISCPITVQNGNPVPANTTTSFRARCTKQP